MIAVLASAILFGLVHPGSKLIMSQGISLLPFCFLYVTVRLIAQLPLVLTKKAWKIVSREQFSLLLSLGVVGALLQLSEFCGINNGLPVGVVSFLVYTHPVWTVLLSRIINKEEISKTTVLKLGVAIAGVVSITGFSGGVPSLLFLGPLAAGLFIALWISLSNRASKTGCSAITISFYYDAFAFLILGSLLLSGPQSNIQSALHFVSDLNTLSLIVAYSIFIGYLPNFLFYWGSKSTSAQLAGFTLLLEPVISTLVSHVTWNEPMSGSFFLGAVMILSTNLPLERLGKLLFELSRRGRPALAPYLGLILLLMPSPLLSTVHVVEIVPSESSDYTVIKELTQLKTAAAMAEMDFKKEYPKCTSRLKLTAHRGTEAELYSTLKGIGNESSSIVVGLSRTNFARLAAKALENSKVKGLSVGAAFANLTDINSNFGTIVSPWQRQWEVIFSRMKRQGCGSSNSIGIFDAKNVLSQSFQEKYMDAIQGKSHPISELLPENLPTLLQGIKCAFIAVNFSDANPYLTSLIKAKWVGSVVGIGDWNYYSSELNQIVKQASYSGLAMYMPTGWIPEASARSKKFASRILKATRETPSPLSAYAYDATWMAFEYVCNNKNPLRPEARELSRLPLLREYEGVSDKGNYLAKMFEITKRSKK